MMPKCWCSISQPDSTTIESGRPPGGPIILTKLPRDGIQLFLVWCNDGKIPYVDARDVAAVAALILAAPEHHRGKTYVLTGSEAISYRQTAAIISSVIDKPVRFVDETPTTRERAGFGKESRPPSLRAF
jgi:uncharacterized protein YbjT (DUF2867 family)